MKEGREGGRGGGAEEDGKQKQIKRNLEILGKGGKEVGREGRRENTYVCSSAFS
jgi:hypothetical protein